MNPTPINISSAAKFIEAFNEFLVFVSDKKNTKTLLGEMKAAADELRGLSEYVNVSRETADKALAEAEKIKAEAAAALEVAGQLKAENDTLSADIKRREIALVAEEQRRKILYDEQSVLLSSKIEQATQREKSAMKLESAALQKHDEAEAARAKYEAARIRIANAAQESV